jgi:hypothetical protein
LVLGGRAEPGNARRRVAGAQHGGGRAVCEQRGCDHVSLAHAIGTEGERAQFDRDYEHDLAGLRAGEARRDTEPADAAGAPEPENGNARDVGAETDPAGDACLQARGGHAGGRDGDDDVDVTRGQPGAVQGLLRRGDEEVAGDIEIGFGAIGPVARAHEPVERPRDMAPLNAGIGKDLDQSGMTLERGAQHHRRKARDLSLDENVRRDRRRDREHGHRADHRITSWRWRGRLTKPSAGQHASKHRGVARQCPGGHKTK